MRKKYNNNSRFFKDWTVQKLKKEARMYADVIYKVKCYGMTDIRNLMGIEMELDRRNIDR